MVKHIILWQLKDELSEEEKQTVKAGIKEGLEVSCRKGSGTDGGTCADTGTCIIKCRCNA